MILFFIYLLFYLNSFVSTQERRRVYAAVSEEEEKNSIISLVEDLPHWISNIGEQIKTYGRLIYIDNIWFYEESRGFLIPFAAFEHEKDGNLRTVMDHLIALDKTLKSNPHLKEINPLYFLVAKDDNQAKSYERSISEHGEWRQFRNRHKFSLISIDLIKRKDPKFVLTITDHLTTIPHPD